MLLSETFSLLNIIGTIDKPTAGSLYLFGQEVKEQSKDSELASIRLCHVSHCHCPHD